MSSLQLHQDTHRHQNMYTIHPVPHHPRRLLQPASLSSLLPLSLARGRIAHRATFASHRPHAPTSTMELFCMPCASRTSLTLKITRSLHNAESLRDPLNGCLRATYAWERSPRIQSPALILAGIPSATNVCADTSPHASVNIGFLFCVLLVLQIKGRRRGQSAVRVACARLYVTSLDVFPRGLAVRCHKPRTYRRAIQHTDGDGTGLVLYCLILSKVRSWCLFTDRSSAHSGTGA